MELTSIDYSRLIQFTSIKNHRQLLNKTQVNKILFYVYGVYYAVKGKPLFTDDTPKAWTYGPVFPIPNKRFVSGEIIRGFTQDKVEKFKEDRFALRLVIDAVKNMHDKSALQLTEWSHELDSPWYKTIYAKEEDGRVIQNKWNTRINEDDIKQYFSLPQNRIFDNVQNDERK